LAGQIKVILKHSVIGSTAKQREIVRSLGLGKRGSWKIHKDNPSVRGAIRKVAHLLEWEEV